MKTLISFFTAAVILTTSTFSQSTTATTSTTKQTTPKSILKTFPHVQITAFGGAIFPMPKVLNQSFKPGPFGGLEVMYRINREVGLYVEGAAYFMESKINGAPVGTYFQYSGGPRYVFTKSNIKSQLFAEVGVGGYTFVQKSYADPNILAGYTEDVISTRMGVNGGLGADLALSDAVGIQFKSKYHAVFTNNETTSFITVGAGLSYRFR